MIKFLFNKFNSTLSVQPREWPVLSLMIAHFFFALCVVTTLRSVNTGLFLGVYDASLLPWYYLGESVFSFVLSMIYTYWVVGKVNRQKEIMGFLFLFILILVMGRILLFANQQWVNFALPIVTDSFVGILILQTWALFSDCINSRQTKRLFPLIGVGGTCGAIFGGWFTSVMAGYFDTEELIFLLVILLVSIVFTTNLLLKQYLMEVASSGDNLGSSGSKFQQLLAPLQSIFNSRLFIVFILILVCTRIASTIIGFEFQAALQENFQKNEITQFVGRFLALTNLLTLLTQGFLESRLLTAYGLIFGLAVSPFAFVIGLGWFIFNPSLVAIASTRLMEHVTRNSFFKTANELIYIPFDSTVRRKIKVIINGILGLATVPLVSVGLILLGQQRVLLSLIALGFGGAAIVLSFAVKSPYAAKLSESLKKKQLNLEDDELLLSESYSNLILEEGLYHEDNDTVLFTLEYLQDSRHLRYEQLEGLLTHGDPRIRASTLSMMSHLSELPLKDNLITLYQSEGEVSVKRAFILVFRQFFDEELNPLMKEAMQSSHLDIKTESIIFLFTRGGIEGILAGAEYLKDMLRQEDEQEVLLACAYALGEIGIKYFQKDVRYLLSHPDLNIRHAMIKAAGESIDPKIVPILLDTLKDRGMARLTRLSLKKYPSEIMIEQCMRLFKTSRSLGQRIEIIKLLRYFDEEQAFDALITCMLDPDIRLKYQALKSLAYLRKQTSLHTQSFLDKIHFQIQREFSYGYSYYFVLHLIYQQPFNKERSKLLVKELKHRIQFVQNMLFKLLALIYSPQTIHKAYLNFKSGNQHLSALSIELLSYTLRKNLAESVLTFLDDIAYEKKVEFATEKKYIDVGIGKQWWHSSVILEDPIFSSLTYWCRQETPQNQKDKIMFNSFDKIYLLKQTSLFKNFSVEQLKPLVKVTHSLSVAEDTVVIAQDEPGDAIYILVKGKAMVERNGKEITVIEDKGCFGEVEIINAAPRLATVKTLESCELLKIKRDDFLDLLEEFPDIAKGLIEILFLRLRDNFMKEEE